MRREPGEHGPHGVGADRARRTDQIVDAQMPPRGEGLGEDEARDHDQGAFGVPARGEAIAGEALARHLIDERLRIPAGMRSREQPVAGTDPRVGLDRGDLDARLDGDGELRAQRSRPSRSPSTSTKASG